MLLSCYTYNNDLHFQAKCPGNRKWLQNSLKISILDKNFNTVMIWSAWPHKIRLRRLKTHVKCQMKHILFAAFYLEKAMCHCTLEVSPSGLGKISGPCRIQFSTFVQWEDNCSHREQFFWTMLYLKRKWDKVCIKN